MRPPPEMLAVLAPAFAVIAVGIARFLILTIDLAWTIGWCAWQRRRLRKVFSQRLR